MAAAKKTGANLTLIRGRKYTLVHPFSRRKGAYLFEKGVPRPVHDPEVVEYAMGLTQPVIDSDGAEIHKPMFRKSPLEKGQTGGNKRAAAEVEDEDSTPARRTRRRKL